jgi:hypothetical protein
MSSKAGFGFIIGLRPPIYLMASRPAAFAIDDDDEDDMMGFELGARIYERCLRAVMRVRWIGQ